MPEPKTGIIQSNLNTPFNELPSAVSGQSFDSYVLIGKKDEQVTVWSNSDSDEGIRDTLDTYETANSELTS
jgi:hypothetical protein